MCIILSSIMAISLNLCSANDAELIAAGFTKDKSSFNTVCKRKNGSFIIFVHSKFFDSTDKRICLDK